MVTTSTSLQVSYSKQQQQQLIKAKISDNCSFNQKPVHRRLVVSQLHLQNAAKDSKLTKSMRLVEAFKRKTNKLSLTSLLLLATVSSNLTLSFAIRSGNIDHGHDLFNKQRQILDQLSNQKQLNHYAQLAHRLAASESNEQQQQQQQQHDKGQDENSRRHLMAARQTLAHLLQASQDQQQPQQQQQQQQQQPSSYWTMSNELSSQPEQPIDHRPDLQQQSQFVSYRPLPFMRPTTPSINRQLIAPPQFYDMNLAPINTLQVEQANEEVRDNFVIGNTSPRASSGRSLMNPSNNQQQQSDNKRNNDINAIARSNNQIASDQQDNNLPRDSKNAEASNQSTSVKNPDDNNGDKNNSQPDSSEMISVDKTIEPRQKRRIFNRILKKAEWNHLFVELSKVFLRYFLDLALKDIIGKQSGSDSTTSRKKLDAQSELTDLLKDFVKTAISNI